MENVENKVATKKQLNLRLLGFLLAYPVGYLYWELLVRDYPAGFEFLGLTIFSIIFIVWSEIILRSRKEKTAKGSYFWYGVMVATSLLSGLAPEFGVSVFGVHLCAIYAVLFANNNLLGDRTCGLLPLDIMNGMFIKGLGNFWRFFMDPVQILKARKDLSGEENTGASEKKNTGISSAFAGFIVVLIAFVFLTIVVSLLSKINEQFGDAVNKFFDIFAFDWNISVGEIIIKMFLAVPVSVLLYGAISKCASSDGSEDRKLGAAIVTNSKKLRVVKDLLINIVLGVFILIYAIFFVFEGSYIFGAFFGNVPEGFNVVAYARNGFFELIWVMVINMLIFFLVNSFTKESSKTKLNKVLLITLMSTSVIFAIVSFTKLSFYFARFGYTPKRILAMWGAVILLVAAGLVIASVIKGKSYTREWIIFTVISYLVLCLVSGAFKYVISKDVVNEDNVITVAILNESDASIQEVSMCIAANMFDYYDLGTCSNARSGATLIECGDYFVYPLHGEDLPKNFLYGNYVVDFYVTFDGNPYSYSGDFTYDPSVDEIVITGFHVDGDGNQELEFEVK